MHSIKKYVKLHHDFTSNMEYLSYFICTLYPLILIITAILSHTDNFNKINDVSNILSYGTMIFSNFLLAMTLHSLGKKVQMFFRATKKNFYVSMMIYWIYINIVLSIIHVILSKLLLHFYNNVSIDIYSSLKEFFMVFSLFTLFVSLFNIFSIYLDRGRNEFIFLFFLPIIILFKTNPTDLNLLHCSLMLLLSVVLIYAGWLLEKNTYSSKAHDTKPGRKIRIEKKLQKKTRLTKLRAAIQIYSFQDLGLVAVLAILCLVFLFNETGDNGGKQLISQYLLLFMWMPMVAVFDCNFNFSIRLVMHSQFSASRRLFYKAYLIATMFKAICALIVFIAFVLLEKLVCYEKGLTARIDIFGNKYAGISSNEFISICALFFAVTLFFYSICTLFAASERLQGLAFILEIAVFTVMNVDLLSSGRINFNNVNILVSIILLIASLAFYIAFRLLLKKKNLGKSWFSNTLIAMSNTKN
ncbi:hypothetical protein IAI10_14795 [Clostridium sp. 19966]|uniref:hypothetical protein n=1 Tax=Clostridium sp. 19966 TaxID=2768166 RepID=UPI0028DFE83B|nr:hypothetical protein [Clostridium sp. 19966]MDT8717930.1 hypothetical protein [Clostridium sp. 19966]